MSAKEEIDTVCNNLNIYFNDPKIREAVKHICNAVQEIADETEQLKSELKAIKSLLLQKKV